MSTYRFLWAVCLLALGLGSFAAVAAEPVPGQKPESEAKDPNEKDTVKIKGELQLLGKVFRRRLLLHYLKEEKEQREAVLKQLASESAAAIKRLLEKDSSFKRLDYHFLEKIGNCERRLLAQLRHDKFQGVEDLLEFIADQKYPNTAAYARLMGTVEMNFHYARRKELVSLDDFAKDVSARLTAATLRVQGTAGHAVPEVARDVWKDKKPDAIPAWWFDPASGPIVYEFASVPRSPEYPWWT